MNYWKQYRKHYIKLKKQGLDPLRLQIFKAYAMANYIFGEKLSFKEIEEDLLERTGIRVYKLFPYLFFLKHPFTIPAYFFPLSHQNYNYYVLIEIYSPKIDIFSIFRRFFKHINRKSFNKILYAHSLHEYIHRLEFPRSNSFSFRASLIDSLIIHRNLSLKERYAYFKLRGSIKNLDTIPKLNKDELIKKIKEFKNIHTINEKEKVYFLNNQSFNSYQIGYIFAKNIFDLYKNSKEKNFFKFLRNIMKHTL